MEIETKKRKASSTDESSEIINSNFNNISSYFQLNWTYVCSALDLDCSQNSLFIQPSGTSICEGITSSILSDFINFSINVDETLDQGRKKFILSVFDAFSASRAALLNLHSGQFNITDQNEDQDDLLNYIRGSVGALVLSRLCQLSKPTFSLLRNLSRLTYEKAVNIGFIVFQNNGIIPTITFEQSVHLSSIKDIRKLVEVTNETLALLIDPQMSAIGLCELVKDQMVYVQFCGRDLFKIGDHNSEPFMSVVEGIGSLIPYKEEYDYKDIIRKIARDEDATDYISKVVKEARKQSHGTMIVISDKAEQEVKCLGGRSIKSIRIDHQYITQLAGIDGAIYLDTSGYCHGFGVILDGLICKGVRSERGSRFNSAVKYTFMKQIVGNCLAFVMSEDGGIDPIHNFHNEGINLQFQRSDLL